METNEVVHQHKNDPSATANLATINAQLILDHSNSSTQEQPMHVLSFHSSSASVCSKGPACIVIGCKNGQTNSSVKYYQVPFLSNSNNIARQWYINTLREDLLEMQLSNPLQNQTIHHVCIEHFDEESFLIGNNVIDDQEQIMVLKQDAVPSLFEIEVFQKMIHYQEQLTSNSDSMTENKLTVVNVPSNDVNSTSNTNLPSINQPKSFIQNAFSQNPATIQPPSSFVSESSISNMIFNGEQINVTKMANKRTRIDPEVRAALIQRVPKAVKRTATLVASTPTVQTSTVPQKAQKAVKHTMPQIITTNQAQMQSAKSTSEPTSIVKQPKAVKRTNSFLKEMLPPPIMQSTKRSSVNKAIKHTGGLPHSYYQNQATPILNSTHNNSNTLSNITSSSLNTNTNSTSVNSINVPLNNQTNKLTITTTYVYKRITQPPEIDLSLECEEEELVYVKAPVSVALPKTPSDENKFGESKIIETVRKSTTAATVLLEPTQSATTNTKTDMNTNEEEKTKEKCKENENENEKDKDKLSNKTNVDEIKTEQTEEICKQNRNEELEASEKLERKSAKEIESVKIISKKQSNTKQQSLDAISTSTITHGISVKQVPKSSDYTSILFKYYSRRQGELAASAAGSHQSRRAKVVSIPVDMRPGNYPVKCNVCDLILENNIELTSHICSHLESDSNTTNTYISPFDAVTTTCALCNSTFRQPFELIKHLDLKHMKELNEYKCRICEHQHSKLSELIAHLNRTHSHQEMPYKCDACGFRTSFYADAIYHIKKEHTSTLRHFCPYCLKSITLPYSKRLGHVQSNMFYAHLITHFNKQEKDVLMPSKCKHCDKCILHVRHMRDHLMYDHNCNANEKDEEQGDETVDGDDGNESKDQVEELSKSRRRTSRISSEQTKVTVAQPKSSTQKVGRKRRLTNDLDERAKEAECVSSGVDSNQLEEEHSSQNRAIRKRKRNSTLKEIKSEDEDVEVVSQSTSDSDETKWKKKSQSKRTSRKSTSSCVHEETIVKHAPYMRKQKALKQTNVKKMSRRSTARITSSDNNDLVYNDIDTSMFSAQGEEILSALLIGNLKFHCIKREFKCIECNETELRNHYNNEYTCHQCFYNTNCSKSFEFHLHGHLDKKRVALWNKKLQPHAEFYKCACGFETQSCKTDSYMNADVGNRVALHLLKCEHKYVKYEEKRLEDENNETKENSNRNPEVSP